MGDNWKSIGRETVGRGHLLCGLPCQDRTYSLQENGVSAIALSDGAGSAPLSHEGAEITVRVVCRTLCGRFEEFYAETSPQTVRQMILDTVRKTIAARATELEVKSEELKCTLLAVAVKGDRYLLFHVGDGVIAYRRAGRVRVASAPTNGEYTNSTVFVTMDKALREARVLKGCQPELEGFLLMSDGPESSLYNKKTRALAPLAGKLMTWVQLMTEEAAGAQLEKVMKQLLLHFTQDDCSLAVMTRRNGCFGDWERMTLQDQATTLGVKTSNRNRRRRAVRRAAKEVGILLK